VAVVGRDGASLTLSNMGWPFEDLISYPSRGTCVRAGDVLGSAPAATAAARPSCGDAAASSTLPRRSPATWSR
jgi:hypothetical protein